MKSNPIENKEWLLSKGYKVVHQKTEYGYRAVDVESGLFVCASCGELLNQECRAPYDALCPCCRLNINLYLTCKQIEKGEVISNGQG